MNKIENPYDIVFSKMGMDTLLLIANDVLINLDNVWNFDTDEISLKDISDKYPFRGMLLIYESPLSGRVFRWGNYSDMAWYEVGTMSGYA